MAPGLASLVVSWLADSGQKQTLNSNGKTIYERTFSFYAIASFGISYGPSVIFCGCAAYVY